jgi:alcohol dehydrogenase class IV
MKRIKPFSFFTPTRVEFGAGKINQLVDEVKNLAAKKPFVITDKGIAKAGILAKVEEQLRGSQLDFGVFSEVESNPKDTTVERALDLAKEHGADLIIAVGGGSPMDTAKAVGMLMTNGGKIHDYFGVNKVKKQALPIITIPTTAGTGAEVAMWAVITDTRKEVHKKDFFGSPLNCPTVALVDPLLTIGLPPHLTAFTGMDALAHAIESYYSLPAEPIADALALAAIRLISDSLVPAVLNGENLEARENMMLGSLIAGIALGNTDAGVIHCLGQATGGFYDLHHGLIIAVFMPYGMEYNLGACPEKFAEIAKAMGENVTGLPLWEAARKSIDAVVNLLRTLRIPTLKAAGVKEKDLGIIAKMSLEDGTSVANPRKMTLDSLEQLLVEAYNDKFQIGSK